jgi:hypothetical protein
MWLLFLLLGLILGATIGFGLSLRMMYPAPGTGTVLLHKFSFQDVAEKAGHPAWEILEDKTYFPFPPLARAKRTARRIVARSTMSDEQLQTFARQFKTLIKQEVTRFGANQTGEVGFSQSATRSIDGQKSVRSELQMPRLYYVFEGTHGVADMWLIAEGDQATVVICFTE